MTSVKTMEPPDPQTFAVGEPVDSAEVTGHPRFSPAWFKDGLIGNYDYKVCGWVPPLAAGRRGRRWPR